MHHYMYAFRCIISVMPSVVGKCEILIRMLPRISINVIGIFTLLCRLAFCGFFNWHGYTTGKYRYGKKMWKHPKIIFTIEDLKQCGLEVTTQFDGFGLLKATHIHDVPVDTSIYNFPHLSAFKNFCFHYTFPYYHSKNSYA